MQIGRWSELSINRVCQEHEVMRDADANETSGKLSAAFGGTLGGGGVAVPVENTIVRSSD